jgi:hypothetical protein
MRSIRLVWEGSPAAGFTGRLPMTYFSRYEENPAGIAAIEALFTALRD